MTGFENLALFIAAGLLLNITPGPDMLYVAARSTSQGRQAGVASALGITAGSVIHTVAAAAGLSALMMASAIAFEIVRWAGVVYLVFIGVRTLLAAGQTERLEKVDPEPIAEIFREGVIVNVLNPKVALFFLSFLPQFVDPGAGSVALQIIVLGTIFNTTATMVNTAVALGLGSAGEWFGARPAVRRAQAWFTGLTFIGLGVGLALMKRQ